MAWSSASISLKVWWARWWALRSRQNASLSLSSGAYFGSHSTVSQWARAASAARESLLVWIGPVVLDQDHGPDWPARLGAIRLVELLEMGDEVTAALGRAGLHDQLPADMIERAENRHLLCLTGRGHPQVGA